MRVQRQNMILYLMISEEIKGLAATRNHYTLQHIIPYDPFLTLSLRPEPLLCLPPY